MTYLLDANVFIEASKAHYSFDVVPAFWRWLEQAHTAGVLYTIEAVVNEIIPMGDELSTWMAAQPRSFKLVPTANDQPSLQAVALWANSSTTFTQGAKADFLANADYYLVAQAHSLGYVVVTHELPDPRSRKRIKIPDACNAFGIPWMSPFTMLASENIRFDRYSTS